MTSRPGPGALPPPPPAEQIRFLQDLQRILDEGSFTATYKYALLHAIADLCVIRGDDTGATLELSTGEIAERYIELYWRQAVPFPGRDGPGVLAQNTGAQAAIVRQVREARAEYDGSLARMKRHGEAWRSLRDTVDHTLRLYPVGLLQNIGGERHAFLYEDSGGRTLTLKPGVAYCFRVFYPMIVEMVEGAWSQYIRRHNQDILGSTVELRSFLFGSERNALARLVPILGDLQEDACFYCRKPLARDVHVDHFIPWRRYPVDLGHNFVLAHDRCNGRKGDRLAAEDHLMRWAERNDTHARLLEDRFGASDIPADLNASRSVARWAYSEAERVGGSVWVTGRELRPLGPGWREAVG